MLKPAPVRPLSPGFTGGGGGGGGGFKSSGPRRLAQQSGVPQKRQKCPLAVRVGDTNGFISPMLLRARDLRPFLFGYFLFTPDLNVLRPPGRLRRSHALRASVGQQRESDSLAGRRVKRPLRKRPGRENTQASTRPPRN